MYTDAVVNVENLSHSYGKRGARKSGQQNTATDANGALALDDVSLQLKAGQVTALLGPNGAGKTTLIKLLLGLLQLQQGEISVMGCPPGSPHARQRIGVMLQASGVQENLNVLELMQLFTSLYQQPGDINTLLHRLDLAALVDKRFQQLSGGQQQRVLFAIALCGNPQLLILDEPSTGMDPAARRGFWQVMRECRDQGRAILLCTHHMDEAEELADDILVLDQGRVLMQATPMAIRRQVPSQMIEVKTALDSHDLSDYPGVKSVVEANGRLRIYCHQAENVLRQLLAADETASELEVHSTDLETAFLALTQTSKNHLEQAA